ncbi:hypothetical protein MMC30_000583, partial [Trapelia coarctata]|nr:hypothetical protein [Trapelia coarctata]
IDGEYQCNRNRHNLRIPDENTRRKHTEIEFLVKQKELMLTDGSLWGKPWRFEKIMVVPENIGELANCAPYDGEYLGTIEVIVLRCRNGPKSYPTHVSTTPVEQPARPVSYEANSKRAMVKPMAGESDPNPGLGMFLDGTVDTDATHSSKQLLGLDGNWDDQEPKSKPDDNQQWGWEMTGSETGEFKPISQGRYDSNKSSSKSRSSGDQSRADERGQIHASQSAPAGSPAVVIN